MKKMKLFSSFLRLVSISRLGSFRAPHRFPPAASDQGLKGEGLFHTCLISCEQTQSPG